MNARQWVGACALCAVVGAANAQTGAMVVERTQGGVGAARTLDINATITAIDPKTREITLKGPKGNELVVEAGPRVKNFDQMKVGDQVKARYVEALTLELKKGGGQPVAVTRQADAASAKAGKMPAAIGGHKITVVANVTAVDPKTQTVTLKGPERTVDVKVADPEAFKKISTGDQVEATYSEALAVSVERANGKAAAKK